MALKFRKGIINRIVYQSGVKNENAVSCEVIVSGFAGYNEADLEDAAQSAVFLAPSHAHSVPPAFSFFAEDGKFNQKLLLL